MSNKSHKPRGATRFAVVVAGTLLALGLSGAASAHDDDDYYGRYQRSGHGYGHYKHHKHHKHRKHQVVTVVHRHYHQPPVREVHHHYYEQAPQPVHRYYRDEPRPSYYEPPAYSYPSHGASVGGIPGTSLIGAAVGGLVGSHVGNGSGRLAATAAGTLGGFLLGGGGQVGYR